MTRTDLAAKARTGEADYRASKKKVVSSIKGRTYGKVQRGYEAGERAMYLRGRMLAAQLSRELRERFDEDWFRNPRTGPFLGDWFATGMRFTAIELATRLGEDRLGADALLQSVRESLP